MAENTNNLFFATVFESWITLLTENDSINVLSDVDTTTNAPSYGQVLVYENVGGVGRWRPNDYTPASRISAQFVITANGSTDYVFNGDGFIGNGGVANPQNDPVLYLKKGHTYEFVMNHVVLIHSKLEFLVVVQTITLGLLITVLVQVH